MQEEPLGAWLVLCFVFVRNLKLIISVVSLFTNLKCDIAMRIVKTNVFFIVDELETEMDALLPILHLPDIRRVPHRSSNRSS